MIVKVLVVWKHEKESFCLLVSVFWFCNKDNDKNQICSMSRVRRRPRIKIYLHSKSTNIISQHRCCTCRTTRFATSWLDRLNELADDYRLKAHCSGGRCAVRVSCVDSEWRWTGRVLFLALMYNGSHVSGCVIHVSTATSSIGIGRVRRQALTYHFVL